MRASLLVGVASLLLATCAGAVPELDQPAPALKGTLFSGAAFDLGRMRGRVVLVNFYSSYCKFCAYEIGNLETFYEEHKGEGFEVIALGVDELADRERVARMLAIYNLPGTMVDELRANGFGQRYPTPTTFLIDRNGILRYKRWGAKTPEFYREVVLPLLLRAVNAPSPVADPRSGDDASSAYLNASPPKRISCRSCGAPDRGAHWAGSHRSGSILRTQ